MVLRKQLAAFGKRAIFDVWLDSEYPSACSELPSTSMSLMISIKSHFIAKLLHTT